MDTVTSSPSMIALFALILVAQALSLLLMMLNAHLFRRQREKILGFLRDLGDETALGTPGRWLLPMYILTTVVITIVTLYLFIVQPHIL